VNPGRDVFITFEGIEGCGKTTQAKRLAARLRQSGISVVLTLEPGGTRLGQDIRRILLDFRNHDLVPMAELFLYAADRAQHVSEIIQPALCRGNWVVCDRFFDATTVYQGLARGQDMSFVQLLNERAAGGIRPDVTFVLDCPVEVGLERALGRQALRTGSVDDRFEREDRTFHEAVRQGYLSIAEKDRERFVVIDSTLGPDDLESAVYERILPFMPGTGDERQT